MRVKAAAVWVGWGTGTEGAWQKDGFSGHSHSGGCAGCGVRADSGQRARKVDPRQGARGGTAGGAGQCVTNS
ncbi:hypothetical protein ACINB_06030 [Acidovorax sp. NB1]|nr:hypothetical protein ACINB_06030 [Acidovorax sp. NB1]